MYSYFHQIKAAIGRSYRMIILNRNSNTLKKETTDLFCSFQKRFSVLAAMLTMILFIAIPAYADRTITLDVKKGQNITYEFREAAYEAKFEPGTLTIIIPPGTYKVNQLCVWGHTTIKMNNVTLVREPSSKKSMCRLGYKSEDFDYYNNRAGQPGYSKEFSDITFIGGTWDGSKVSRSLMQYGHAMNMTFQNVTFKNVKGSHHMEFAGCKGIRLINCKFSGYFGDFGSTYNGEAIQFEILTGVGKGHFNGYHPIDDETTCRDIEITGCIFDGLKRGVGSHTAIANSYFTNFKIHDNVFKNITGYAISMMNYANSSVYNNKISNCGCGILCATSERSHKNFYKSAKTSSSRNSPKQLNNKIYNNTISINRGANGKSYNNANYGIWLFGEKLKKKRGSMPKGDWRCSGVTVTNNVITMNVRGGGIWLTGTVNTKIAGNTIKCQFKKKGKAGAGAGVWIENGSGDEISGNIVSNVKSGIGKHTMGIYVTGSKKISLVNNRLIKCGKAIQASKKQLKKNAGNKKN